MKASGLAAGKGVVVANTRDEACAAVDEILGSKKYGSAGNTIVVEEKLAGEEISVRAIIDHVLTKEGYYTTSIFSHVYFEYTVTTSTYYPN